MTKLFTVLALFVSMMTAHATELDPVPTVPSEIIVREDAQGNREVFKVNDQINVTDVDSAKEAVANYVIADNAVKKIVSEGELDRVSSTESWYFWNYNWYGCNWYGNNYYYRPYFSFTFNFNYYYYYRWY